MYKKKRLFLFSIIILTTLSVFGQKELYITEKEIDLSSINTSDSAVVKIESTVLLSFDSNTDDPGFASKPYTSNGFYVYVLKFPTGRAYKMRELTIESDDFISMMYPLHDLKGKDQVALFVADKDIWKCYENNLKTADDLYARLQYAQAAKKYEEVLKCGYELENNNLGKKIKNAGDCAVIRYAANSNYSDGNYIKAKEKYEELYALNPNDTLAKERIDACQAIIDEQKAEEEKRLAEQKAEEERKLAELKEQERKLAEQKAEEERKQAELKAEEERKLAEQKAAEEKRLAELKAQEEKEIAERKAKEEQLKAEAEEKKRAEQKAEEERKLTEQKVAEEKRLAELKVLQEKQLAEQKEKEEQRKIEEEKKRIQQRAKTFLDRLPASVTILSSGETKTFDINHYEIPWEVSNIPAWCSIEKKDNLLILNCEPNTNTSIREGSFDVRVGGQSKKVLIKQNRWTSLSVSRNHIEFESSGGKDTLTVSTNAASWKTLEIPSWCTVKQLNKSFILTCNNNPNTSVREGKFYVQAGDQSIEISVKQKAKIFLELSNNIIKFGKIGGKNNLTVQTNASSWKISNEISWCQMEKTENSIIFSCEANPNAQDRNETFHIIADNESKVVQVSQIDITNLEKGYWKHVIENVIHYKATPSSGGLFKGSSNGLGVYYFSSSKESYWGELSKGLSNGKGIHILEKEGSAFVGCPDCKYYAGNWSDDKKSGKGNCYDKTGKLLYSDLFVNDKPDKAFPQSYDGTQNFECIEYEDGDIYLGETLNGLRHGLGIFFWNNGDTWYGEWKEDKRNGNGIEYQYDGAIKTRIWNDIDNIPKQSWRDNYLESKTATAPILTHKGSKIYKSGTVVPKDEVREMMANTTALQLYDKGIMFNKIGNIALISGGSLFATGLIVGQPMANSKYPNLQTAGNVITGIGVGIGAVAILSSVALKLTAIKNIENSIKTYNAKTKSASAELRFNFTGNGVGLSLGF